MDEIADAVFHILMRLLEVIGQTMQQGASEVAVGRVNHQTRLLVDDDDVVVFVNDVQRDRLRFDVLRGDDITEILSCYLSLFGKPIPNAMRKGINEVFQTFDEYTLAKYKGEGKDLKMRDIIMLCHPAPKTDEQSAMWKRCLENKLETPVTWHLGTLSRRYADNVLAIVEIGRRGVVAGRCDACLNGRDTSRVSPFNVDSTSVCSNS